MGVYTFRTSQILQASLSEVWEFISNPSNLKLITPPGMGFDITTQNLSSRVYPGMIISYLVAPFAGIRMRWITEITHITPGSYFVDEQRVGPYSLWHHEHHLEVVDEGVRMTDIVTYRPPFGFIGSIANSLIIRSRLNSIFGYREKALNDIFPQKRSQKEENEHKGNYNKIIS
jgi:ligand-binding SRPBCC domain-containing protein